MFNGKVLMMGDSAHGQADSSRSFRTTRWTRIALARGSSVESRQALEELCEAYYRPVESYIRARVRDVALREIGLRGADSISTLKFSKKNWLR